MERNPGQIAESQLALAEEFSRYGGELAKLIKSRAEFCKSNKDNFKSDTATQRAFETTDDGVRMTVIELKLKTIARTMSANKDYLKVKEGEARNLY